MCASESVCAECLQASIPTMIESLIISQIGLSLKRALRYPTF